MGRITLSAEGERTHVLWISEGRVALPWVGLCLDRILEKRAEKVFFLGLSSIR